MLWMQRDPDRTFFGYDLDHTWRNDEDLTDPRLRSGEQCMSSQSFRVESVKEMKLRNSSLFFLFLNVSGPMWP